MKFYLIAFSLILIVTLSCEKDSSPESPSVQLTSADRDKFIGTWAGSYACPTGQPIADTLVINVGGGALDFSIVIHAGFFNPDTLFGELTDPDLITLPQQTMGGAPGTAKIAYENSRLAYSQTAPGFRITCGGTDYERVP